jgi:hypothetical protein
VKDAENPISLVKMRCIYVWEKNPATSTPQRATQKSVHRYLHWNVQRSITRHLDAMDEFTALLFLSQVRFRCALSYWRKDQRKANVLLINHKSSLAPKIPHARPLGESTSSLPCILLHDLRKCCYGGSSLPRCLFGWLGKLLLTRRRSTAGI